VVFKNTELVGLLLSYSRIVVALTRQATTPHQLQGGAIVQGFILMSHNASNAQRIPSTSGLLLHSPPSDLARPELTICPVFYGPGTTLDARARC
jgi:hypothetical protein